MIAPKNVAKARQAIVVRPVPPPSPSARRKLAASMRRLGADEETITQVTQVTGSAHRSQP